jgi:hypothetical protein
MSRVMSAIAEAQLENSRKLERMLKAFRPGPDYFELCDGKFQPVTESKPQANKEDDSAQ